MIKTIAIDDEPLALQRLISYIEKTPFLELTASFESALTAMEFIEKEKVDLIFLDIQMPDLSGTEFARTLKNPPKIVFTTAYEKYAIEGFRLDAIHYLLKPYSYEDFLIAAQKAKKYIQLENSTESNTESNNEFLFVKSDYKTKKIIFNDILYIEGLKDYIKVYLHNEVNPMLSINSLKSIEQKLPSNKFMRVHRSFIVNLDKIEVIERSRIVFGKVYIPISDQYKDKFQDYLDKNLV
jgi:DNA-binding LytR/AlgR family response regulator